MRTNTPTLFKALVIIILLAPSAAAARGQTDEDPCAPEAQRSSQLLACARRQYAEASSELGRVRSDFYDDLEPRSRAKLKAAERLWLGYRRSNCDAEASVYEGGTIQPLVHLRCMTRLTRERSAELRAQLQTLRGN